VYFYRKKTGTSSRCNLLLATLGRQCWHYCLQGKPRTEIHSWAAWQKPSNP
jgi:hypothetical protein